MRLVNLMPHEAAIQIGEVTLVVPPSGTVARVSSKSETAKTVTYTGFDRDGNPVSIEVPHRRTVYGEVVGLPAPEEGVTFIVSAMVKARVPDRADVVSPDTGPTAIRKDGQIVAVTGLQE
jgi:hypothetical protein